MATLKIKLKGHDHSLFHKGDDSGFGFYEFDQAYTVESPTRGDVPDQVIEIGDNKIVELGFEDDTVWMADNESITKLFPKEIKRSADSDELFLPDELESGEQDRGVFKKVAIKLVKVFVKKNIIKPKMIVMAKNLEDKQLAFNGENFQKVEYGILTSCSQNIELSHLKFDEAGMANLDVSSRYLLLLHGTGSSTLGSFGELKDSDDWKKILKGYGEDHLLAYQHRTLTSSPLQNILQLIKQLPSGVILDLLSHSRGGLLADLLARFSTDSRGFDELEISFLQKHERESDLKMIEEIIGLLKAKDITIRSIVRVACPANGTTLASGRLNIFLNVTFNLAGLAIGQIGNPIFVAFKEFILEAVSCKDDVEVLPGLEAMSPNSPFVKAMNYQDSEIVVGFPLYIVGGSSELSLDFKTLVVILGKLFFMRKNDLVVDTESMNWGARRTSGNVFVCIEKSGAINHFKYFSNPATLKAVLAGLGAKEGEVLVDFEVKLIISTRGIFGIESGAYKRDEVTKARPIALVIPGIMGSNLGEEDQLIWINYWRFLKGDLKELAYDAEVEGKISAHSLIRTSYGNLGDRLAQTYDIVTFQFDWRVSLKKSAELLKEKVKELLQYNQPIKIVAHSMGGVLVRDFIVYHPDIWQKLNKSIGFKAVFLGSPLGGSYRIPYVLFGKDSLIKLLGKIDIRHSTKELLSVFCNFPGILNLLPLSNNVRRHDFSDRKFWERMRAAFGDFSWPIPTEKVLKEFAEHQQMILDNSDQIDYSNFTYVAGQSGKKSYTVSNLSIEDGELLFSATNAGDESVTWASGIPAQMMVNNQVYYANVPHGGLPKDSKLFSAIEELLKDGKTTKLQNSLPKSRGELKEFKAEEAEIFDISEENVYDTILGKTKVEEKWYQEMPIHVNVSHGNLRYAKFPVVAGHFEFDSILTTEKAIDSQLDGELSRLHSLGLYPGPIGTHQIVLSEKAGKNDFKGGIIIGLGVPGELSSYLLMNSVEKGVARYLTIKHASDADMMENDEVLGVSVIAIANSYGGLSTDSSIRAIMLGIQNANRNIRTTYKGQIRGIDEVEIIELFNDKALSILKTIQKLVDDDSKEFNLSFTAKSLHETIGKRWRIPYDVSSDWWCRISVCHEKSLDQFNVSGENLRMSIATNGASEKVETIPSSRKTLEFLLKDMTLKNQFSQEIAKVMFELLIPYQFKEEVKRLNNISWVLDIASAEYPWEMMQESLDTLPLCIHTGMVRQLTTMNSREKIARVNSHTALIVGDPHLDQYMHQLPGAKREAEEVTALLRRNNYETESLISSSASQIILKIFTKTYKIIHLAGHGVFDYGKNHDTGMVIGKEAFLTPGQLASMSSSAELIFVNCCYLGQFDQQAELTSQQKNKFAANIGTQLIDNGARAVIVAGWAVDDDAALEFSQVFYQEMFDGVSFGEAVKRARKSIYKNHAPRTNTWGAFQCYGDPFYKLTELSSAGNDHNGLFVIEEIEIELKNMRESLEASSYQPDEIKARVGDIEKYLNESGTFDDTILELVAGIYGSLKEYGKSCDCYKRLINSENSLYSIRSFEQYCNMRVKQGMQVYELSEKKDLKATIKEIDTVISDLKVMNSHFGETVERLSLLGRTLKRKIYLVAIGDKQVLLNSLTEAVDAYEKASQKSKFEDAYSLTNWLCLLQLKLWAENEKGVKKIPLDARNALKEKYEKLTSKGASTLSYWDMANEANMALTLQLLGITKINLEELKNIYGGLWKTAGSKGQKEGELEHIRLLTSVMETLDENAIERFKKELIGLKEFLESIN